MKRGNVPQKKDEFLKYWSIHSGYQDDGAIGSMSSLPQLIVVVLVNSVEHHQSGSCCCHYQVFQFVLICEALNWNSP